MAALIAFFVLVFTSPLVGNILVVLLILLFLFGGLGIARRMRGKGKQEQGGQEGGSFSSADRESFGRGPDHGSSATGATPALRAAAAVLMRVADIEGPGSPEWTATRKHLLDLCDRSISDAQADVLMLQATRDDIVPSLFDEEERLVLLRLAVEIAAADGVVGPRERTVLEDLARKLGLAPSLVDVFIRLVLGTRADPGRGSSDRGRASSDRGRESSDRGRQSSDRGRASSDRGTESELDAAYRTLGVRRDAPITEIRTAYRNLMKKHHPDRAPPGRRAEATRRTAEINAAYDLLIARAESRA